MLKLTQKYGIFLFIFVVFFVKANSFIDPDFGWHITEGQQHIENGIAQTDTLSYSMGTYQYISHTWLSDSIISVIYRLTNYQVLAATFSLLAAGAVYIATKKAHVFSPIVAASFLMVFGVRIQVLSIFLFTLLVFYYPKIELKYKTLFLFLLFALWANLHGGFLIGLLYLSVQVIQPNLKLHTRVQNLRYFAISSIATMLNPYGIKLIQQVIILSTSSTSRAYISEWSFHPLDLSLSFIFVVCMFLISVYSRENVKQIKKYMFEIILLFMSVLSIRNTPFFIIVAIIPITNAFHNLQTKVLDEKISRLRFETTSYVLYILFGFLLIIESVISVHQYRKYSENTYYPKAAVSYIRQSNRDGNLFAPYNWGGYLDWKLQTKKVFIDGRMDTWNRDTETKGEVRNAFQTYMSIVSGKETSIHFQAFRINTVLWFKNESTGLVDTLLKDGWEKEYEDSVSVIYTRPLVNNKDDKYN